MFLEVEFSQFPLNNLVSISIGICKLGSVSSNNFFFSMVIIVKMTDCEKCGTALASDLGASLY